MTGKHRATKRRGNKLQTATETEIEYLNRLYWEGMLTIGEYTSLIQQIGEPAA